MQRKTTMSYHYAPPEWLKLQRLKWPIAGDVESWKFPCTADRSVNFCSHLSNLFGTSTGAGHMLHSATVSFLSICPTKMHPKTCTRMFTTLFITLQNWDQSRCLATAEVWYSHTEGYYAARKMNELLHVTIRKNHINIMWNERSQTHGRWVRLPWFHWYKVPQNALWY